MVLLNVQELLDARGKTRYWLWKHIGTMSYQNFKHMIDNETRSIRYDNIEILCQLLECTPNDLFVFTENRGDREPHVGGERKFEAR